MIIDYIKASIEILINLKVDEKLKEKENEIDTFNFNYEDNDYEKLLRKLEGDIRQHIQVGSLNFRLKTN